jgi:uncharacterized protein
MKLLLISLAALLLVGCTEKQPAPKGGQNEYPLAKLAFELEKKVDGGDAGSQELLGWMYLNGMGVAIDPKRAADLFRKAAAQGNARAQRHMGHLTLYGHGVDRDPAAAIVWFKKAVAGGEGWAYLGLLDARRRVEGELALGESFDMIANAEEKLMPQTDARSAIALYSVAKRVTAGPVQKHAGMTRALEILTKAAGAADADAQRTLGEIHKRGDGVPQDIQVAVSWFEKAAAQGDAPAQVELGAIYLAGEGFVSKNVERARYWYEKSAAMNHVSAQYALGQIYGEGTGVTKQSALAAQWYQRAAAQRHSDAQNNLGVMYTEGDGVPKDMVLAYAWFNLAAAEGHTVAKDNRDRIELNTADLEVAQKLSTGWKIGQVLKR